MVKQYLAVRGGSTRARPPRHEVVQAFDADPGPGPGPAAGPSPGPGPAAGPGPGPGHHRGPAQPQAQGPGPGPVPRGPELQAGQAVHVGIATLRMIRSSIRYYFVQRKVPFPPDWDAELTIFFKGVKNIQQREKQDGLRPSKEGKSPMPFSLLKRIASHLLSNNYPFSQFAHTYMLMSWNLMCRSENTRTLAFAHFEVDQDSIGM